jgi:16S rRNA G966 N2-methylase RsmD
VLKKNIANLRLESSDYRIAHCDALEFAKNNRDIFDLYLLDPPYNYPPLQELVNTIAGNICFENNHMIVAEHEITNPIRADHADYRILKQKKVGRSLISFIMKKGIDER